MSKAHIVVVDDEKEMRELLKEVLQREGYDVTTFSLAVDAVKALANDGPLSPHTPLGLSVDTIISDIKMAQMDGMEFLTKIKDLRPDIPVILITAFGSIDSAIEAMQKGAFHYVVKPFKLSEIKVTVEKAIHQRKLTRENKALSKEVKKNWALDDIIGKSSSMRSVYDLINRVAQSNANVLITGESGTGKELVARAIHNSGPRSNKPFVAINCTAIPEELLESELFGHSKGAFTGAVSRKKGLFEEATGGTLFLDEIGDMSPALQAKLLRAVQEKKIRAVGDTTSIDIDVRILAATHKDLKLAIKDGRFREDLYYRLSVIPIQLPPLRDRSEDIILLAEHFLAKYAAVNNSPARAFAKEAKEHLLFYKWPGNVRELENAIERAVVLNGNNTTINGDLLPKEDSTGPEQTYRLVTQDWPTLTQIEERYMKSVLEKTAGRKDRAAQMLGINRRTLYRKEREYGFVEHNPQFEDTAGIDADNDTKNGTDNS